MNEWLIEWSMDWLIGYWCPLYRAILYIHFSRFTGIYWYFYETLKRSMLSRKRSTELPTGWAFLFGAMAGTIAGVATLPFDVVKTHRQIELGQLLGSSNKNPTASRTQGVNTLALLMRLYREKGVASLFSGVAPRIAKIAPSCAIMISSYEFFKAYFRRRNALKNVEDGPNKPSSLPVKLSTWTNIYFFQQLPLCVKWNIGGINLQFSLQVGFVWVRVCWSLFGVFPARSGPRPVCPVSTVILFVSRWRSWLFWREKKKDLSKNTVFGLGWTGVAESTRHFSDVQHDHHKPWKFDATPF